MSSLVRNPPFLFTYWNPFNKDANLVQSWFDYVKDTSLAKYTADTVGHYLQQVSDDQISAIDSTGRKICGTLYEGFADLQNQLRQTTSILQGVNQRLDLVLDEARTSNLLKENMAELLRIPDSQKQRQYHIEMALKFLKNALKDEDLYQDALGELLDAQKLMPSDYFVLHRIGMIYLYVPELGNLEKAADYFTKAAKYAFVESHPDAARLSNILNKNVSQKFAEQTEPSSGEISALAAESYYESGTSLYALGRFEEAVKMAEKAIKCQPSEGKYFFFLAKYLTRAGKPNEAVPRLQKAIELLPEMALAALGDFDLNRAQLVLGLLNGLDNKVNAKLKLGIQRLEKCLEVAVHGDASQWIFSAQESFQKGNYLQKLALLAQLANTYAKTQCNNLASRYASDEGRIKNEVEAARWHRIFAWQNVAAAQHNLGRCYFLGRGVEKDEEEAVKWFHKAAEQNVADAQFQLGLCYDTGQGVAPDLEMMVRWYRKAAEQNHAQAQFHLGSFYSESHHTAGYERDDVEMVKWYRKAAEQNYAAAQYQLGKCYFYGQGVEKDEVELVKWYRKAAEQNYSDAQCDLGTFCAYGTPGTGLPISMEEALKWWRKAAEQGHSRAIENLSLNEKQLRKT